MPETTVEDVAFKAIDKNKFITSLGIGLTNSCNLNCQHCYSRQMRKDELDINDIEKVLNTFPSLEAVNFGTGESYLNKDFIEIVRMIKKRGIKVGLTSNGYSIAKLNDQELSLLDEVDISIDFPDGDKHDNFRGAEGTFSQAISSVQRLKNMGIEVSVATALMKMNYRSLPRFKDLIRKFDIPLRLNIYKSVNTDIFALNYDEFWEAMKIVSENFELISSSEPILSIITKIPQCGSPCGNSLRLHPDGNFTACVYLNGEKISVEKYEKIKLAIPEFCGFCKYVSSCRGGCVGRRVLSNRTSLPDEYCPLYLGREIPDIQFIKSKESPEYIHSSYLCTIIIR